MVMKFKDYEPIKFEILQSDMEKYMNILNDIIINSFNINDVRKMEWELQHKIDMHKERGEWI